MRATFQWRRRRSPRRRSCRRRICVRRCVPDRNDRGSRRLSLRAFAGATPALPLARAVAEHVGEGVRARRAAPRAAGAGVLVALRARGLVDVEAEREFLGRGGAGGGIFTSNLSGGYLRAL